MVHGTGTYQHSRHPRRSCSCCYSDCHRGTGREAGRKGLAARHKGFAVPHMDSAVRHRDPEEPRSLPGSYHNDLVEAGRNRPGRYPAGRRGSAVRRNCESRVSQFNAVVLSCKLAHRARNRLSRGNY